MAKNTAMPSGYDYEFVMEVDDEYICPICQLVMRNPVLTKCGHRFCKDCLDVANKLKKCGNQECPVDRQNLTPHQIFEDKATERKILSFKINCPNQGCSWQNELRNVKAHLDDCRLAIVPCSYAVFGCKVKIPRKSLSDHIIVKHLAFTTEKVFALQEENKDLKKQVEELKKKTNTMTKELGKFHNKIEETTKNTNKQVEQLQTNIGEMRTKCKELQAKEEENTNTSEQFTGDVMTAIKSYSSTSKYLAEVQSEVKEMTENYVSTTEELKELKVEIEVANKNASSAKELAIGLSTKTCNQLAKLKKEVERMKRTTTNQDAKRQNDLTELRQDVEYLEEIVVVERNTARYSAQCVTKGLQADINSLQNAIKKRDILLTILVIFIMGIMLFSLGDTLKGYIKSRPRLEEIINKFLEYVSFSATVLITIFLLLSVSYREIQMLRERNLRRGRHSEHSTVYYRVRATP